jgi:hypothetical protein
MTGSKAAPVVGAEPTGPNRDFVLFVSGLQGRVEYKGRVSTRTARKDPTGGV